MAIISKLGVALIGEDSHLQKTFKQAQKQAKAFQKQMNAIGSGLQSVGKVMTAVLTVPLLAIGTAAFKAANEIDEAYDTIRAGTGATGEALKGLQADFKAVFKAVPAQASDVGTAIADLNTRTGLAGEQLRALTTQILNLSRITKSDLGETIASTTRVFGDWAIATDKQSEAIDWLFKVSQSTGIGINKLSQQIIQFGAPLRQMGFSFEQATAILGKFEKEGVNAELAMGSLRIALGKMAREGISDPAEALSIIIQRIKDAGSAGQANAIALEVFGARAGPDMAAAIREGRFEIDELIASLRTSSETVNQAAYDTMSFGEQWQLFKNKIAASLEPLGAALLRAFDSAQPSIDRLLSKVEQLSVAFDNLSPKQQSTIIGIAGIAAASGPALMALGGMIKGIGSLKVTLTTLGVSGGPIGIAILALSAFGVAIWNVWKQNEEFRENIKIIWKDIAWIIDKFSYVIKIAFVNLETSIASTIKALTTLWTEIKQFFSGDFKGAVETHKKLLGMPIEHFKNLWEGWKDVFTKTSEEVDQSTTKTKQSIVDLSKVTQTLTNNTNASTDSTEDYEKALEDYINSLLNTGEAQKKYNLQLRDTDELFRTILTLQKEFSKAWSPATNIPADRYKEVQEIIAELSRTFAEIQAKQLVWGDSYDATTDKANALQAAIDKLALAGITEASVVDTLVKVYTDLTSTTKEVADARALYDQWHKKYLADGESEIDLLNEQEQALLKAAETLGLTEEQKTEITEYFAKKRAYITKAENDAKQEFTDSYYRKLLELNNNQLELLELGYNEAIAQAEKLGADTELVEEYYRKRRIQLEEQAKEKELQTWRSKIQAITNIAQQLLSGFSSFIGQIFTNKSIAIDNWVARQHKALEASRLGEQQVAAQIAQWDAQKVERAKQIAADVTLTEQQKKEALEAMDAEYSANVQALEAARAQKQKEIEEEAEKRRRKMARDQAKASKAIALMEAIVNTARAIVQALPNIPLSVAVGALGAAQVAAIAKQPLPELAEGGLAIRDTIARIGEGRHEEAILPLSESIFQRIANGIMGQIARLSMPQPALALAGGGYMPMPTTEIHLHYHGPVIADKMSVKQFARDIKEALDEEKARRGEL